MFILRQEVIVVSVVSATYRNEPIVINLDPPRFISEIIFFSITRLQKEELIGGIELNDGL